jgi:hypothetical protein
MNPRFYLGAAALAAGLLSPAAGGPRPKADTVKLPDLVPWSGSLHNYRVQSVDGRLQLRFSSGVTNIGDAPLELTGRSAKKASHFPAYQTLFTAGTRTFKQKIGEFQFRPDLQSWDVLNIARYRILDLDGNEITSTVKASFCIADDELADPLPGAPAKAHYRRCPANPAEKSITVGLSIGWADIYGPYRQWQFIDVTDVPHGNYILETHVDPDGAVQEKSRDNNVMSIPITL